ncbi:MAG: FAD-binding oxidoreductase [Gammaproteobacteria bacterium]|nr:FAD-binding oxidoreductase [Gammaproteobacteria bacterium]MDP2139781.1 FAD-binding oxidoreductase [Gammaproteobacteria bacterium]MDP2346402.1 FAD-binding oxidoreductase [Gammaproteobacteria bacterium]
MPAVTFNSVAYPLRENESVLDCLTRHDQRIPHACKSGVCQACLIRSVGGDATQNAKKSLKPTLQAQGFALACQWVPEASVEVSLPALEECSVTVTIRSIEPLNHRVVQLTLVPCDASAMFDYFPGQYLTMTNPGGISRSYSIANNYAVDGYIELHIQHMPHGVFTNWLFSAAKPGEIMHVRGPAGSCFHINPELEDYPILLAGTGTGLAPLYGIAQEALRQDHQGPIHLFHGGVAARDLYLAESLQALADANPGFHYHASCINATQEETLAFPGALETGKLDEVILRHLPRETIGQARVYLCGAPELVHLLRKKIFLQGARSGNIYCDPFIERPVEKAA